MTHALLSFAVVAGLVTLTPGLDTALVLRTALRDGRRPAAATALGINAGVLVWGVLAAVGVGALLAASPAVFTVLRYAGAAYLLLLGTRMLVTAVRGGHGPSFDATLDPPAPLPVHFRRGFLTNLLNPKIVAFYAALLPQFMVPGVHPALMGAVLALVHNLEGLAWFAVVILAAHAVRGLLLRPSAQRTIDAVTGSVLAGFGLRLATSAP